MVHLKEFKPDDRLYLSIVDVYACKMNKELKGKGKG